MNPTSIKSLPAELLDAIIEDVCTDTRFPRRQAKACSLVAKRWRWKAQSMLWMTFRGYHSDQQVDLFCGSLARGRHATRELELQGSPDGDEGRPVRLMEACTGVEHLDLTGWNLSYLPATALALPALCVLKHLTLSLISIQSPVPPDFSFSMSKLSVVVCSQGDVAFPCDVLSFLLRSTEGRLTHLNLSWDGLYKYGLPTQTDRLYNIFADLLPVGPSLRHFSLHIISVTPLSLLTSFFHSTAHLTHLKITLSAPDPCLKALAVVPPSLVVLHIDIDHHVAVRQCRQALSVILPALERLPTLRKLVLSWNLPKRYNHDLGGWQKPTAESVDGGVEFELECTGRAVEVVWDHAF